MTAKVMTNKIFLKTSFNKKSKKNIQNNKQTKISSKKEKNKITIKDWILMAVKGLIISGIAYLIKQLESIGIFHELAFFN